jgi:hypothetical protein
MSANVVEQDKPPANAVPGQSVFARSGSAQEFWKINLIRLLKMIPAGPALM